MNYFERKRKERSFKFCVKQAMDVLTIPKEEAAKRVSRIAEMDWLKDLGGPETREYQTAVDIIMQIPSDKPVTLEAMQEIVKVNKKNPQTPLQ